MTTSRARPHTVVIGAGIGGLTTAALLTRAGHAVTVLEAHVYAGGSAGTFYHRGYRFDAGATLAGGFAPGGPHARLSELLDIDWPVRPLELAWITHTPDYAAAQWTDRQRWRAERQSVFPGTKPFWRQQEKLADIAWDIAARPFPWPPQSPREAARLLAGLRPKTLRAVPYLFKKVADLAPALTPSFGTFLDAQLLISAQATASEANALYGAAALDLPRRGVNHVYGGMGGLAKALVAWLRENGAAVHFRQQVDRIEVDGGRATAVTTRRGLRVACDTVVGNLTPWAMAALLGESAPEALRKEVGRRAATWGAFTLYLGLARDKLAEIEAAGKADHHQAVADPSRPLGEANSVFISISPQDDPDRAPPGFRAATLSTHTAVADWWGLEEAAYEDRKEAYAERMLDTAELALPGLRQATRLALPGTPVTFERFTRRPQGMVGGFPQTSLVGARGPATGLPNVWLTGDSVFPGQSTAGVTLSAMRVAATVLAQEKRPGLVLERRRASLP